jgi:putative tryptophan/tyrosine transport system substrate-binding protein
MRAIIGRQEVIAPLEYAVIARPSLARAEQPAANKRMTVIGFGKVTDLRIGGNSLATIFFQELKRLGYVEEENSVVERYQFRPEGIVEIAREVVESYPDLIGCYGAPMTNAIKRLTTTISMVAYTGAPIRFGLISSLAHPGGDITRVSVDAGVDVWGKRLEQSTHYP